MVWNMSEKHRETKNKPTTVQLELVITMTIKDSWCGAESLQKVIQEASASARKALWTLIESAEIENVVEIGVKKEELLFVRIGDPA